MANLSKDAATLERLIDTMGTIGAPEQHAAVDSFAELARFTLTAEHRTFLENVGAVSLHDWRQARFENHEAVQRATRHAHEQSFIFAVDILFGLEALRRQNDEPFGIPKAYFPLLTPVGKSGGGDLLCQVTGGSRIGCMAMVDHEVSDLFAGLANEILPLIESEPDKVIDRLEKEGVLSLYEHSLIATLCELVRVHEEGANQPPATEEVEWTKNWTPEVEARRQAERKAAMNAFRAVQKAVRGRPNEKELLAEAKEARKRQLADAELRAKSTLGK